MEVGLGAVKKFCEETAAWAQGSECRRRFGGQLDAAELISPSEDHSIALVEFRFPGLEGLQTTMRFAEIAQLAESSAQNCHRPQMNIAASARDEDRDRRSD